ncbi:MAG TPA: YdgA family protein [Gammaproteobacteria bacterium]|nr:YdgA family protein [Gammaproteobacteria bacterium]
MKKAVITGAVVAVAGAGAAAPYVTGMQAEQAFEANLAALSQNPQVEATLLGYDRGWLGAEARTRVVFTPLDERLSVQLKHDIRHGPRPGAMGLAAVTSTPVVPAELQDTVDHYYGDQAPFTAELTIGLDGAQDITLSSPAFEGAPKGDPTAEIQWGGLSGHIQLEPGAEAGTAEFRLPELEVHNHEGNLMMGAVQAESRFRRKAEALWLGETQIKAERMELAVADPDTERDHRFTFRDLRGHHSVRDAEKGAFLTMASRWRVASAGLDGQAVSDAELAVEARHIHTPTLQTFNRRIRALQKRGLSQPALSRRTNQIMRELLPRFLENSPELAVTRLAFRAPQGDFQGSAEARYSGGAGNARAALADPAQLLQHTTAGAEVSVAQSLLTRLLEQASRAQVAEKLGTGASAQEIDRTAQRMVQQRLGLLEALGFLETDNGRYTTEARWEKGRISVNGQPLNGLAQSLPGGGPALP